MIVWLNAGGSLNYILGRSDSGIDLLLTVLFIYTLMNLGYAIFSSYEAPLPKTPGVKQKPKSDLSVTKRDVGTVTNKDVSKLILQNKSYGSGIKTSPKIAEIKKAEEVKHIKPLESRKTAKEEIPAPPLEINIESTEEFLQEAEEPNEKYSGIINDYTPNVIDFFATPPSGTKSAF